MELIVLDTNFMPVKIIDVYESLIWTDRYCTNGDFEIYTTVNEDILDVLKQNRYLISDKSEHTMIIENHEIVTDVEVGNKLLVTGRSLESLLERRIIWGQTVLSGNLQNGIETLLNEAIISPIDTNREISNFVFSASSDPRITVLNIDAQFIGNNLYEVIKKVCESNNLGFRITLIDKQFVFELYMGEDRSYNQLINPYVVFSPEFDNLLSSEYLESNNTLKTTTLVAGEGEGSDREMVSVDSPGGIIIGLARREMFTDASMISRKVDNVTIPLEEYQAQLTQQGKEELSNNVVVKSFEGRAETTVMFAYNRDFFIGDIVQLINEYGMTSNSRVTEIVNSISLEGVNVYPTFTKVY